MRKSLFIGACLCMSVYAYVAPSLFGVDFSAEICLHLPEGPLSPVPGTAGPWTAAGRWLEYHRFT